MIKYHMLDTAFLTSVIPEFREHIEKEAEFLEDFLPHCLYGNILNPIVAELLKRDDINEYIDIPLN